MWTCSKCLFENNDQTLTCANCGTQRSSRRFSSPAVQSAPYAGGQNHFQREAPPISGRTRQRSARLPEFVTPPLSRAARLLRLCGYLLCLFLPLLCLLLCWKQYDVLYTALVPLLTGSAEKTLSGHCCYAFWCLCALLLCLVPGLHILASTGKYKKRRQNEDSKLI